MTKSDARDLARRARKTWHPGPSVACPLCHTSLPCMSGPAAIAMERAVIFHLLDAHQH